MSSGSTKEHFLFDMEVEENHQPVSILVSQFQFRLHQDFGPSLHCVTLKSSGPTFET